MPTNLSNLIVAGGNLQYAQVALSGAAGVNSQTFPNAYFKVPFNAKFVDTNNFCTLNTSLSTITLPTGFYQIAISSQGGNYQVNTNIISRLRSGTTTIAKWPVFYGTGTIDLGRQGDQKFSEVGLYLSSSTSISFEQYFTSSAYIVGYNDGDSNIFYKMDIWKLK